MQLNNSLYNLLPMHEECIRTIDVQAGTLSLETTTNANDTGQFKFATGTNLQFTALSGTGARGSPDAPCALSIRSSPSHLFDRRRHVRTRGAMATPAW